MKINIKHSLLPVIMLFFSINLFGSIDKKAGHYGYQFLKIPVAVELAGMANTGETTSDSPLIMMHHPAAYKGSYGSLVSISHTNWLIDTNMYNLAWRKTNFKNSFGLGLTYVDHGEFEIRTDNGLMTGHYYPMDLNFVVNYTQMINNNLYGGLNMRLLYEKIHTSSSLALTSDLGFVYRTLLNYTNFDLALKNLFSIEGKLDQEATSLPFIAEIGFTTGKDLNDYLQICPSVKLSYMQDHDNVKPSVGLSVRMYDSLTLRLGYKFNYNEEDISAGVGFDIGNIEVNYSYINNLDNVHLLGLSWRY